MVRDELAKGGKAVADYQGNCRVLELQEQEAIRGLTSPGSEKARGISLPVCPWGKHMLPKF